MFADSAVGRLADCSLGPFDRHPAPPGELEQLAGLFERQAGQAVDLRSTTDRRFTPAEQHWHGLAAAELSAAPVGVRRDAAQASDAMVWLAGVLRFWRSRVGDFNRRVDELEGQRQHGHATGWSVPAGPEFAHEAMLARQEYERRLREQYYRAYDDYIDEGSRAAAAMLRQGPSAEHLALLSEAGVWGNPSGAVALFLPRWHDQAMQNLANELAGLATRLNDPTHRPTEAELRRLAEALERYGDDEAFAYYFLTELGPAGLYQLTGTVALMQVDDGWHFDAALATLVGTIQTGLGMTLATATAKRGIQAGHPGAPYHAAPYELSSEWIAELAMRGRERMPISVPHPNFGHISGELYGYQLLGVLMQSPEAHFDSRFLNVVGGDLLQFEMTGGWSLQGEGLPIWHDATAIVGVVPVQLNWIDGSTGNQGYDPVIGLMSALERNPDGARDFFTGQTRYDGTPGGRLPRVDYLLTDRVWLPDHHGVDYRNSNPGHKLLGQVLVRATTEDPDSRAHRIVESIIFELATDEQAYGYPNDPTGQRTDHGNQSVIFRDNDIIPPYLRESMGEIASFYIDDMFWNTLGRSPADGVPGDHVVHASERHTQIFLADLGKDPQARDQVAMASTIYAGMVYDYYLSPDGGGNMAERLAEAERWAARPAGLVFGALDFGQASVLVNEQQRDDAAFNQVLADRYFMAGLGMDAVTSKLSGPIGSTIGELMDRAQANQRADRTGASNYEVGELQQLGRDLTQSVADAALYRNLTPDQVAALPPELVRDGAPVPFDQWSTAQQRAWDQHLSTRGSELGAIDDVDRRYDAGYARARSDLEGYSD